MSTISRIKKRDGSTAIFDQKKITEAIWKAAQSIGGQDYALAEKISNQVCALLEVFFKASDQVPSVEQIQDLTEKILIENGHAKTAKAFILYREEHKKIRQKKAELLGSNQESNFSLQTIKLFQQYFLQKNEDGSVTETPESMLKRIAKAAAEADASSSPNDQQALAEHFYEQLLNLRFIPESSILQQAGTHYPLFFGKMAGTVEDTLENIFEVLKNIILLHQAGIDISMDFSHIRPRGDFIKSSTRPSSGPGAFMKIFKNALSTLEHGTRKQAEYNHLLRIDHPDIVEFLAAHDHEKKSSSFGSSIIITDEFWQAFEENREYDLINPRTKMPINRLNARSVFDVIMSSIQKTGQPSLLFEKHPNPEDRFAAYPRCYINLKTCLKNKELDKGALQKTVDDTVKFLDNILELSHYALPNIKNKLQEHRPIGIGLTGFADLLLELNLPYHSEEAINLLAEIVQYIAAEAQQCSKKLAKKKGAAPGSAQKLRNTIIISLDSSPVLSKIAECANSVEPLSELVTIKQDLNGLENISIHPKLEQELQQHNLLEKELLRSIAKQNSLKGLPIPYAMQQRYITPVDLSPSMHIRFQARLEQHCATITKKIPVPEDMGLEELRELCKSGYRLGIRQLMFEKSAYKNSTRNAFEIPLNQIALPFFDTKQESRKGNFKETKRIQEVVLPPISAK